MIDVCILAGGKGSRLAKVWSQPKCLVPVDGVALLTLLLQQVLPLQPRRIVLALAHQAEDVLNYLNSTWKITTPEILPFVEPTPTGTACALRGICYRSLVKAPVLVLNGDTLPLYDLKDLVFTASILHRSYMVAAWGKQYAGATVFRQPGMMLLEKSRCTNLDTLILPRAMRFNAAQGYLDVGTEKTFHRARNFNVEATTL